MKGIAIRAEFAKLSFDADLKWKTPYFENCAD